MIHLKKSIFAFALSVVLLVPIFAYAQVSRGNSTDPNANSASVATVKLDNPLGNITSPQALMGKVITAILGVVGSIALIMFIFGGLTWMTSGGSPEKVKKGRDAIVWSAIGLAVIFASYGLVRFVLTSIQ